jgi:hypothetical protein
MQRVLVWLFDLALAANGAVMLAVPKAWYALVPGVPDAGPCNAHFVRDIGAAYLVAGAALIAFLLDRRARPAALAGAAFLTLHALIHCWDLAAGRETLLHFAGDIPTVILPGLIFFKLLPRRPTSEKENDHAALAAAAADRRFRT